MFDVWITLVFGVIGTFMRKLAFPIAALFMALALLSIIRGIKMWESG